MRNTVRERRDAVTGQFRERRRLSGLLKYRRSCILAGPVHVARWEFLFELDRSSGRSCVQQIAQALRADIQRGRLRPGQRLPGSRTIAKTLGVHRQTVVSATDELIAEGWLVSTPASGTFVAGPPQEAPKTRERTARPPRRMATRFAVPLTPGPDPELPLTVPEGALLMSGSRPDLRLVPADLIGRVHRRVLRKHAPELLSYNHPAGLLDLRRELAAMLSATRGLAVDHEGILVTRGSQMALALTARALIRPGDAIAVEHPGYHAAWDAFRIAGAEIVPVPVDDHGFDVAALARLLQRRSIRAVYVTPHHQFPTTVTMTGPRRLELLQLAAGHRFAIIEDDYDHEFHYRGRPVLPIASSDAAGVVVYLGTLSKVLAPGLRLGFVAAPADLIAQLAAYRSHLDLQGDALLERTIAELLEGGLIQRHVRKVRRVYRSRLATIVAALRKHLAGFLRFQEPSGGTAIWVRTRDARTMVRWSRAAREHGVIFEPPGTFTLDGTPEAGTRLGFAPLDEDEIGQAVKRLAAATSSLFP